MAASAAPRQGGSGGGRTWDGNPWFRPVGLEPLVPPRRGPREPLVPATRRSARRPPALFARARRGGRQHTWRQPRLVCSAVFEAKEGPMVPPASAHRLEDSGGGQRSSRAGSTGRQRRRRKMCSETGKYTYTPFRPAGGNGVYSSPPCTFPLPFLLRKSQKGGNTSKTACRGKAKENQKQTSATKAVLRARVSTKIGGDCETRRLDVHPLATRLLPPGTQPHHPNPLLLPTRHLAPPQSSSHASLCSHSLCVVMVSPRACACRVCMFRFIACPPALSPTFSSSQKPEGG